MAGAFLANGLAVRCRSSVVSIPLEGQMPGSVTGDPQYWRDRAAKMRALAPTMKDPEVIIQMAHLAADYENLAERAARRSNGLPALDSPPS